MYNFKPVLQHHIQLSVCLLVMFKLLKDFLLNRYIEGGCYKGFISTAMEMVKRHFPNIRSANLLPWKVYTNADLAQYGSKISNKTSKKLTSLFDLLALSYYIY